MNEDEQEVEQPEDELEEETGEEEGEETSEEEDGEPASITSEAETEETSEEEEPATVYLPTGEGPATARLREMLDPDVNAAVQAAIAEQVSRAMQTFGVTQASYAAAAAQHPEVFRKYGGKIQMALAMFPEQERHTRKSVDLAIALATIEDKAGKPEFAREFLKVAQQLNGSATAPKPPKAPIPAASRPPTPSSGVRSQATTPRDSMLKMIMKDAGVTKAEAEELIKGGR